MLRDDLSQLIASTIDRMIAAGELPEAVRSPVEILDTKQPEHGDYACNFALSASKKAGMNPRELAEKLRAAIMDCDESGVGDRSPYGQTMVSEGGRPNPDRRPALIHEIEIAGPGFLNLRLKPEAIAAYLPKVLQLGSDLPNRQLPTANCQRINVEFVSVNPNGPITVGSARGAAFGDTLCRVLEATGNQVHREYYINDGVNSEQMRLFAESVRALAEGRDLPDGGYRGDYVADVAAAVRNCHEDLQADLFAVPVNGLSSDPDLPSFAKNLPKWLEKFVPASSSLAYDDWDEPIVKLWCAVIDQARSQGHARIAVLPRSSRTGNEKSDSPLDVMFGEVGSEVEAMTIPANLWNPIRKLLFHRLDALEVGNKRLYWLRARPGKQWPRNEQLLVQESTKDGATVRILPMRLANIGRQSDLFRSVSEAMMIERQRSDLGLFGVDFDTWFSEQSLHDSAEVARCIEGLVAKGAADEEPHRIVLKLARGGVIEEVVMESQTEVMEPDDDAPGRSGSAGVPPAPQIQNAPEPPSPTSSSSGAQASPQEEGASASNEQRARRNTLWLRSTKFGDDMDRVLRRRDGRLTYIASDVAYHKDKLTDASGVRGTGPVDKLITILGPDHHGYIHRLQAVLGALLEKPSADLPNTQHPIPNTSAPLDEIESKIYRSPEERDACKAALQEAKRKLEVVIFQIVRFVKDGKAAPMRKRDGNIYELRDLINEVGQTLAANATKEEQMRIGADVARFFYLMRSHDSSMDFDIDLATKQSDENPVFYVQYAHARICSVIRRATDSGVGVLRSYGVGDAVESGNTATPQRLNTALLSHPRELTLIKKILDLPMEVQRCAEDYGVHRLTTYAIELGRTFHHFYDACRVIQPDQPELTASRLALCEAARLALKATLDLLGVSAPEKMERSEPSP